MNAQHTEGPWSVEHDDGAIFIVCPSGTIVEVGLCGTIRDDADEANARLIAAAPEMLAALRLAAHWLGGAGSSEACRIVSEAIEKASSKCGG